MKRSARACLLALAVGLFTACGCSKPASEKPSATANKPADKSGKTTTVSAQIERPASPMWTRAKKEPTAKTTPVDLEKNYQTTTNQDHKVEIIYKLSEDGSRDAVVVLGRLFQSEPDADLKGEILNALSVTDGSDAEKMAIYTKGAQTGQPDDVRLAAIDGLSDIEDLRVIPILQGLTKDPNTEISKAARTALEQAQTALAPQ